MSNSPHSSVQLKGHSGAIVTLESADGHSFVRKKAARAEMSARLQAQADKQQAASDAGVACPQVLARGSDEGCFFFDMEYIPSISVARMLMDATPFNKAEFCAFVEKLIFRQGEVAPSLIPQTQFLDKVRQVHERCALNVELTDLMPAIQRVYSALMNAAWQQIPQTTCHGDLTLENILYSKDRGYFVIDFDEVDLSSNHLDAGKLFQDLWGHWCLRDLAINKPGHLDLLNAVLHVDSLRDFMLRRLVAISPAFQSLLAPMVLLHLFRVLPYCRDQRVAVFVLMRANQIILEAGL